MNIAKELKALAEDRRKAQSGEWKDVPHSSDIEKRSVVIGDGRPVELECRHNAPFIANAANRIEGISSAVDAVVEELREIMEGYGGYEENYRQLEILLERLTGEKE